MTANGKMLVLAAVLVGMPYVGQIATKPGHAMAASDLRQRALSGDLAAQRDLAECLEKGCDGTPPSRALACAWRTVVVAGGSPEITAADVEMRRLSCQDLAPDEQATARDQAKSIFQQIHGRELVLPADYFGGPTRRK